MKYLIIIFCLLFFTSSVFSQNQLDSASIEIKIDTQLFKNYSIQILQKNNIIKAKVNEKVLVKRGADFIVDIFENKLIIKRFGPFKLNKDTSVEYGSTMLESVIVKSQKRIVSENTQGFDYFPQNDSLLRDKSILLGLQRLPFINGYDDLSVPKYRQDGKILFLINGKQRKGIDNNWAAVLGAIKGKDVYKVELIEDIQALYKSQGFEVVINILTLDENIYGTSFDAVLFFDQRKNFNPSLSSTILRKKLDFSINVGSEQDNQNGERQTKILNNKIIQSELLCKTSLAFEKLYSNIDIGYRKDSLKDFGLNISFENAIINRIYVPLYQFGLKVNGIAEKYSTNRLNLNFSYIFRKKKGLTISLITLMNNSKEIKGNNIAFNQPKQFDSIASRIPTKEISSVIEYNILDTRKKTTKEFGIKIYNKNLFQDFNYYNLNGITNEIAELTFSKIDSFTSNQYSVRLYIRAGKNLSQTKRITFSFYPEFYYINNTSVNNSIFFTPSLVVGLRKILNKSNSIRYKLNFNLYKPNIDFLSTVQAFSDPQQQSVGNSNLKPSKNISVDFEWVRRKKTTFSNIINLGHSFDNINFFRLSDPITNKINNISNNKGKSYFLSNTINYQFKIAKKVWCDTYSSINYSNNLNSFFNTKFSRITFYNQSDFNYDLGGKNGFLQGRIFYTSNQVTSQGFSQGTRMYGLVYSNQLFKKKIAFTFIANQFLLNNRKRLTYTVNNNYQIYTYNYEPYRYLKIRLAYRFSNIKVSRIAEKKSTDITGEINRL